MPGFDNNDIDYDRLEKIQMKAADKLAKRPIFLDTKRIDTPLPEGAGYLYGKSVLKIVGERCSWLTRAPFRTVEADWFDSTWEETDSGYEKEITIDVLEKKRRIHAE